MTERTAGGRGLLGLMAERPLLGDGAMGTQLYENGVGYDRCFDALNVERADLVARVHEAYIAAGAELIETNTFGANRFRLAEHGLADQAAEIAERGARIARSAADAAPHKVWVCGSIGPTGAALEPAGSTARGEVRAAFAEQAAALERGGADVLMVETMRDLSEAMLALEAARAQTELPVFVLLTFESDGHMADGTSPEDAALAIEGAGADAVGANCSTGPAPMLDVVVRMAAVAGIPLVAMPNAGLPKLVGGRYIYTSSPAYMADRAARMVDAGVSLVGGCCGTSPEHIAAIRRALAGARRDPPLPSFPQGMTEDEEVPGAFEGETALEVALRRGGVVIVHVEPPRGFMVRGLLRQLGHVVEDGRIQALCVADGPGARARLSALAMGALIQGEMDADCILQIGCCFRNLVATHSELMGAHALGARDLLITAGDLPANGDYPDATVVHDVNEAGLIHMLDGFNHGRGADGRPLRQATSFHIGCEVDFAAHDPERALRGFEAMVEAGARFAVTRPVFDAEVVAQAKAAMGGAFPVPVVAGIMPLWDERHAGYLHNEVPGIEVSQTVLERLAAAAADQKQAEGKRIAAELTAELSRLVAGVAIVPPFGRYEIVPEILDLAGIGSGNRNGSGAELGIVEGGTEASRVSG